MKKILTIYTLLLLIFTLPVQAETAYVTDLLYLGVHKDSKTSDKPFKTLASGTAVQILKKEGRYAQVKLQSGETGWVKAAYLLEDKPARAALPELEERLLQLQKELQEKSGSTESIRDELTKAKRSAIESTAALSLTEQKLAEALTENRHLKEQVETVESAVRFEWAISMAIVMFAIGILLSFWLIDRRIRKRYGGYRIY